MVAGHLTLKNGKYYAVLNYKNAGGQRKTKWISLGLSEKGNKRKAEAELARLRAEFEPPKEAGDLSSDMDYKQCIIDKGYAEPTFDKYDNGIYALPSYNTDGASKEAVRKLNDDLTSCSMLHVTDINTVYRLQLGNPKLLLNDKEVAADCLRKEGIKPKDYTADKLEKDLESGESAGLRDNRKALTCLVTAGVNVTASDETVWYPLK